MLVFLCDILGEPKTPVMLNKKKLYLMVIARALKFCETTRTVL